MCLMAVRSLPLLPPAAAAGWAPRLRTLPPWFSGRCCKLRFGYSDCQQGIGSGMGHV